MKKVLTLLFAAMVVFPLATALLAQGAPAQAKPDRWEGKVVRISKDKSSLTVRQASSSTERTVVYDSSTKWESQYRGDKTVNSIDASEVKDDDYVICMGTWGEKGAVLHATLISKRLAHSPK